MKEEVIMLKSRNKNQTAWRFICILLAVTALLSCFMLSTANAADTTSQSDNTITSAKDIPGKKVGVQLGTTGDDYVTEYEGDEKGTTIERYNKAADAIQSLKQQNPLQRKILILRFSMRNLQRNNMLFA